MNVHQLLTMMTTMTKVTAAGDAAMNEDDGDGDDDDDA